MKRRDRIRLWRLYQHNIRHNKQFSLRELDVPVGEDRSRHFVNVGQLDPQLQKKVDRLLALWQQHRQAVDHNRDDSDVDDEQKIVELGLAFWEAAEHVRRQPFYELLATGVPVNFQHPQFLETALHVTCSRNAANDLTEHLLDHPEIDLLLRDQFGRRAWNIATFFRIQPDLTDRVFQATLQQAIEDEGQTAEEFQQDYHRDLSKWMCTEWYATLARREGEILAPRR